MNLPFDPTDLDSVIATLYTTVSGPAGPRDWSHEHQLFHPSGRLIRTGVDAHGKSTMLIMTPDEYIENTRDYFASNDFYEVEITRETRQFGNICHIWSTYEARRSPDDLMHERRGINSIQLLRDASGAWRIINMIWDNERQGAAISR